MTMDIQLLLLRALPYAIPLYGLLVAATPQRLAATKIWLGAVGIAAAIVAIDAAVLAPEGVWLVMPVSIAALYSLTVLLPSLAVAGAAIAVRRASTRIVIRLAVVAAVFVVTYTVAVRYAQHVDIVNAVQ